MGKIIHKIQTRILRIFIKRKFDKVVCDINSLIIGADVLQDFIIKYPENLQIGRGTSISGKCYINALAGVSIGEYCHIAKGLTIFSHNHNFKSTDFLPYDSKSIYKPVSIGDVVWIGSNVSIAPGAKIGNGVIISMGAVVFGEIPDGAIIRGNPAVIIGYRDTDVFNRLYNEKRFK